MTTIAYRLHTVHARLKAEIKRELKRRSPDEHRLTKLKKLKLAIKDRLYANVRRSVSAF
jgi:hypothetical protein